MLVVDNSGLGNCMYYSYSISLMYFLRARKDKATTEDIFNKLNLKQEDKDRLFPLLDSTTGKPFTRADIDTIIEPVLGPAVRNLGAQRTREEYLASPRGTGLFTSANYGIEYFIKESLRRSGNNLHQLIDNNFKNPNFIEAEVYRVDDILSEMRAFAQAETKKIVADFKKQSKQKIAQKSSPKDTKFQQERLLEELIRQRTESFFMKDNHKMLNRYIDRINTNYVWGTEETLNTLNCAVQGERLEQAEDGKYYPCYDTPIALHIDIKDQARIHKEKADIIIEHRNGCHWVSKIPGHILNPNQSKTKASNTQKQIDVHVKQQAELKAKELLNQNAKLKAQLPNELKAIEEQIAADKRLASVLQDIYEEEYITVAQKSYQHLHSAEEGNFRQQLKLLASKIIDFEKRIKVAIRDGNANEANTLIAAKDVATDLYTGLDIEALKYFYKPTHENYQKFKINCEKKLEKSREILGQHRGWLQLLGNIGLAILGAGVLYLAAVCINHHYTGKYLFFKTESEKIVDRIDESITNAAAV
jgi:hypothetical protein